MVNNSIVMTVISNDARLHLILGPMFSGKTSELLGTLTKQVFGKKRVLYINHAGDTRSEESYSTHAPNTWVLDHELFETVKTDDLSSVDVTDFDVIGIDESQFFSGLFEFVEKALKVHRKTLYIAGLNGSFKHELFGEAYRLLPLAFDVKILHAACAYCPVLFDDHNPAIFSYRKQRDNSETVVIGGKDVYAPICLRCHDKMSNTRRVHLQDQ